MRKTTLAVALMLLGTTAFATEKNDTEPKKAAKKVAVINNSPQKFKLVYFDKAEGDVRVSLRNENGQVVHSKVVNNKEGFAQPYDLKDLPAGDYTFTVTKPDGSEMTEKVTLEKPSSEPNFAANILNVNDGKKFRLAVVNKDKLALPIQIKLYDNEYNLIHEEKIENLYGFRKTYDLSDLNGDFFRFTISNSTGSKLLIAE